MLILVRSRCSFSAVRLFIFAGLTVQFTPAYSDGDLLHQQKKDRLKLIALFTPFSNRRLKPRMPCGWYFSDFFGKGSQIGSQASTGGYSGAVYLGTEILKGYRVQSNHRPDRPNLNLFLKEATSFSLINATQILSIPIMKKITLLYSSSLSSSSSFDS